MNDPAIPAGCLHDALAAVLEALDIPHAGTVGGQEVRDRILVERAGHAAVFLRGIFGEDPVTDLPWSIGYLRDRLAEHPAEAYKTWQQRMAELDAAKAAAS
jgi:hypothetical protein